MLNGWPVELSMQFGNRIACWKFLLISQQEYSSFFFFFFCRIFSLFSHQPFTSPPSHLLILLFKWKKVASSRLFLFPFSSALLLFYVLAIYSHLTTTHVSMLFIFQISVWSQQKIGFNLQIHASVFNIIVM